jgi:F1F0 ATPase subunit 2
MTDRITLSLDFVAGLVLGAIFYGGLWWTVRRVAAKAAGLWLVGSFVVRAIVVLAGFYAVARGTWYGAVVCLVGFLVARIIVTCATRARPAVSLSRRSGAAAGARTAP